MDLATLLTIILLGIVEGVTEFIPVSSTGHLILAGELLGYDAAQWAVFNVVIQLGAILAVIVLYWRTFWAVFVGLLQRQPESWRFLRNIAVGFLPSAVVGLTFLDQVEAMLGSPTIVAWALLLGGIAILMIERKAPHGTERGVADISFGKAVGIGFIQCLAMIPGVSRPVARRRAADRGRVQLLPRDPDHARRLDHRARAQPRQSRRGEPLRHRHRLRRLVRRRSGRDPLVHRHRLAPRLRAVRLVPDPGRQRGTNLAGNALVIQANFILAGAMQAPSRLKGEGPMRKLLIAAAATLIAVPASAQPPRPSEQIEAYAPAIDRMADAFLSLDLGPVLDAADPYRPHYDRSLRDLARRGDPRFERRLRASIYGTTAGMGRMADAFAAMEPAMRDAIAQMEMSMAGVRDALPPPPPPRDFDDDWDPELEDYPDDPYDD